MPRLRAINKRGGRYLRVIYLLPEEDTGEDYSDDSDAEDTGCRSEIQQSFFNDTEEIESRENEFQLIPENARLLGVLPLKRIALYNTGSSFFLEENDLDALIEEVRQYAWERLLRYLAYRERSIAECRHYLKTLPLREEINNELLQRAIENKYLDEQRFAELLTQSYVSRNKSRNELKTALISKRIPKEIIERVIAGHYTEEDKREILEYQIEKVIKKYPDRSSAKDYQKSIAYLMRKGFNYEDFAEELKKYYRNRETY
jgi:SOS response regulatory protein OraA/RecX